MPTNIRERAPGPGTQLVGLLSAIRWEAQFKLAKCCMGASISISDLGVFLAEPVLERSKALNEVAARLREKLPADSSRCLLLFCPILLRLPLHRRRRWVLELQPIRPAARTVHWPFNHL